MTEREIIIQNKLGLHARAAAKFVNLASAFKSTIELTRGNRTVNGKSIMGVMMLAAGHGTNLIVSADGGDEAEALSALETLVKEKFGEQE